MYVVNSIGNVFKITQSHISFGSSYKMHETRKNGFESFLWDTFGDMYDTIKVESDTVIFSKEGNISNYLKIGNNLVYWIEKNELGHDTPPIDVHVGDVNEYYKEIDMVDDLETVFPV